MLIGVNKKGFTLVEVIAVIVILLVILIITIPSFSIVLSSNKTKQYNNNVEQFIRATEIYVQDKKNIVENLKRGEIGYKEVTLGTLINHGSLSDILPINPKGEKNEKFSVDDSVIVKLDENDILVYEFNAVKGSTMIVRPTEKKVYIGDTEDVFQGVYVFDFEGNRIFPNGIIVDVSDSTKCNKISENIYNFSKEGKVTFNYTYTYTYEVNNLEKTVELTGKRDYIISTKSMANIENGKIEELRFSKTRPIENNFYLVDYNETNFNNNVEDLQYKLKGSSSWVNSPAPVNSSSNPLEIKITDGTGSNNTIECNYINTKIVGDTVFTCSHKGGIETIDKKGIWTPKVSRKLKIKNSPTDIQSGTTNFRFVTTAESTVEYNTPLDYTNSVFAIIYKQYNGTVVDTRFNGGNLGDKISCSGYNQTSPGTQTFTCTATNSDNSKLVISKKIILKQNNSLENGIKEELGCENNLDNCFYTGANPKNYLWYSGFMWRIVNINSDRTVRIITQNPLAVVPWGENKKSYEVSYIRQWLNELNSTDSLDGIFYNSLKTPTTFLTSKQWDISKDSASQLLSVFSDYVGLITTKEYDRAGGASSYLNIGSDFATLTYTRSLCSTGDVGKYVINSSGTKEERSEIAAYGQASGCYDVSSSGPVGIRPVVNLKVNLEITSGDGTSTNPYKLKNDNSGVVNDYLYTRFAGEYVSYSGKTWRVVSTANSRTRVILNDFIRTGTTIYQKAYDTRNLGSYTCNPYVQTARFSPYYTENIAYYLNNTYYTSLSNYSWIYNYSSWHNSRFSNGYDYRKALTPAPSMVETNDYCRPSQDTTFVYTDVSAKIGLSSIGEMFSGNDVKVSLCGTNCLRSYMTQEGYFISYSLRAMDVEGTASTMVNPIAKLIYRPAFELKNNVKISGGNGTPSNPYILSCSNC